MEYGRRVRRLLKQADEYDAFSKWRHSLIWRPREIARIKRRVHKRERREGKQECGERD